MADSVRQRKGAAVSDGAAVDDGDDGKGKAAASVATVLPDEGDLLTRNEKWMPLIVCAIAAFTRYYRLDQPPGEHPGARRTAAPCFAFARVAKTGALTRSCLPTGPRVQASCSTRATLAASR